MKEREASARAQIRIAVEELERVQVRLQGVAEELPPSPPETEEPVEGEVALRSTIECVLADSLRPAIRDLRSAIGPLA